MKRRIVTLTVLVLTLFPVRLSAQIDGRAPGVYTLIGDESVPLDYTYGGSSTDCGHMFVFGELCPMVFLYKGMTSRVESSGTFVYVINPKSIGSYDPFNRLMNPKALMVIRLAVNPEAQRREYNLEYNFSDSDEDNKYHFGFDWAKLSRNSYQIIVSDLPSGEYAIVIRKGKAGAYDFTRAWCFTVPEPAGEK